MRNADQTEDGLSRSANGSAERFGVHGSAVALPDWSDLPRLRPWTRWRFPDGPTSGARDLWTLQSQAAYASLQSLGVLRQTAEHADPEFASAYQWMSAQMRRRLHTPPTAFPIWFWTRADWKWVAREVRSSRETPSVLLHVRKPQEQVLVSDFVDWHHVLNGALHVPAYGIEHERPDIYWARAEPEFDSWDLAVARGASSQREWRTWPASLRRSLEASWEHIFDPRTWAPGSALQAVAWELQAHEVVKAIRR
jgi:hypothetical protein